MRKGQAALEYLMTYGWVIMIIIIVGGALYARDVFSPPTEESYSDYELKEQYFDSIQYYALCYGTLSAKYRCIVEEGNLSLGHYFALFPNFEIGENESFTIEDSAYYTIKSEEFKTLEEIDLFKADCFKKWNGTKFYAGEV